MEAKIKEISEILADLNKGIKSLQRARKTTKQLMKNVRKTRSKNRSN